MPPSPNAARRPTVDEWGVYDPHQAGLAALYTRLSTAPAAPAVDTSAEVGRTRVTGDAPPPTPTSLR